MQAAASAMSDPPRSADSYPLAQGAQAMKKLAFKKLDAFSVNGSAGNPAGAVYLNSRSDLTPEEMQKLARELKGYVSEVGFISRIESNHYWIRYYSSEREVNFCGHATIAIMYDLIRNDSELFDQKQITISTRNSDLIVENRIQTDNSVFITAPSPTFRLFTDTLKHISDALRIGTKDVSKKYPISIVNAGLETLIVPVSSLNGILTVSPDIEELKTYCIANSIDIITLFCEEVSIESNQYRTRVFAPVFGYLEDPATGSGNAAFGHYLLAENRWDTKSISIEQSGSPDKPNIVKLAAYDDGNNQYRVLFGGNALVRIEGKYHLF
jgi:PhzF family phenazine biosynthesis protein